LVLPISFPVFDPHTSSVNSNSSGVGETTNRPPIIAAIINEPGNARNEHKEYIRARHTFDISRDI
jgi:hypothetical protein